MASRKKTGTKSKAKAKRSRADVEIIGGASAAKADTKRPKAAKPAKVGKDDPTGKPGKISDAEIAAAKSTQPVDDLDSPGFTVTMTGSLPKVFCSIVVKKTGLRASSLDAAVARFVQELAGQFKKPELFAIESCTAVEDSKPKAPRLPFQKGLEPTPEPKKDEKPVKLPNAPEDGGPSASTVDKS